MPNFRRKIIMILFQIFDLLIMTASFLLGALAVSYEVGPVSLESFFAMRIKVVNIGLFLGLLFAWHQTFVLFGLYSSRRLSSRKEEIVDITKATSVGTLLVALAGVVLSRVAPESARAKSSRAAYVSQTTSNRSHNYGVLIYVYHYGTHAGGPGRPD